MIHPCQCKDVFIYSYTMACNSLQSRAIHPVLSNWINISYLNCKVVGPSDSWFWGNKIFYQDYQYRIFVPILVITYACMHASCFHILEIVLSYIYYYKHCSSAHGNFEDDLLIWQSLKLSKRLNWCVKADPKCPNNSIKLYSSSQESCVPLVLISIY